MSQETGKHEMGMSIRREVLGDNHVDNAVSSTTDIDRDFQEWITDNVWGDLWARPGLERRERSLITIGILASTGQEELELHLRAAKNTGARTEDIVEVLLHVAVYAGVPSANRAFKMLKTVREEES